MLKFNNNEEYIYINTSRTVVLGDQNDFAKSIVESSLAIIEKYPHNKDRLDERTNKAVDIIIDSGTCLPADYFLFSATNYKIAEKVAKETNLGISLITTLSDAGFFAFVERQKSIETKMYLRRLLNRLVSGIAMSVVGTDDCNELPGDLLVAWLAFWRTEDGLRWRDDIAKSGRVCQGLREVARAFSRHFGNDSLLAASLQVRTTNGTGRTWQKVLASPSPIEADILTQYRLYAEHSSEKPSLDQRMVMQLGEYLASEGFHDLESALTAVWPRRKFANYILSLQTSASSKLGDCKRIRKFLDFVARGLREDGIKETILPIIDDGDLDWLVGRLFEYKPLKPSHARARPLPERLYHLARQILDEGEEGWAGTQGIFQAEIFRDGSLTDGYCPVIPTLLRCAFDLPLRMAQWRRLDSGEGDLRRFNAEQMAWEKNPAPLAGYWAKRDQKKKPTLRGYAYEFDDVQPSITGFFVNTNKTGQPYSIPWMSEELHKRLYALLLWQQEYNPIQEPIGPDQYLDQAHEYPEKTKKRLPEIFALFRVPPDAKRPFKGRPPTAGDIIRAWIFLMAEVERRWNIDHPNNQIIVIDKRDHNGQPLRSIYSPHGMRVRGITNLHRAGIPIDVLSQMIAGHASIIMTLYYVEYDPATIHSLLQKAVSETQSTLARGFVDDLRNMKVAEARRKTTFIDDTSLNEAIGSLDKIQYCSVDIGVCPFDGTRCHDGGPLLRRDGRKHLRGNPKHVYGPVPGGARNCILCRHLISGPPFILPLELYGSLLLSKRSRLATGLKITGGRFSTLARRRSVGRFHLTFSKREATAFAQRITS
ncbi:hypothetical protein HFO39_14135 [Rhizobium leguminosarum]|uniref:VPA1269 family protein n=1 Tax=Rhizobium leguminosarum TaxID=384 RepID=UPI001C94F559|nr:VPA1269 family protein [Rhizobium leguminosarum]MBY5635908.1 hypothetical protein [Rhizobium leguminosarum]